MVSPKQRMKFVLVNFLDEGDELSSFSLHIGSHGGHVQGQFPRDLKVCAEEVVEHFHVSFLLEEDMVGQVLQHLQPSTIVLN